MKTLLFAATLLAGSMAWCAKPEVIPALREWIDTPNAGAYTLAKDSRVVIPEGASDTLERYAQTFAKELGRPCVREASGWWRTLFRLKESARPGDIVLSVTPAPNANPEGYTLSSSSKGVAISGSTPLGTFWGTRTLLQVFAAQQNTFPGGQATDWPAYKVRGFMFDCGRKPFTLTTLREIVRICSYYKLNDLQLHLSDNYIWLHNYPGVKTAEDVLRVEPSAGGFRLESDLKGLTSEDIAYTKAEFRALTEEAAGLGVTVVPELDVPGHALSMVRVRPDLMYRGAVNKGKHDLERAAMLDLTNPETLPFIQRIFDEYIDSDTFVAPVVHIGTDEYYGDSESYRAFADAMLKHIRAKGKTPRLWGSLSHKRGKTPVTTKGVQMHIWSLGWQNPREALKAGYDIINILDGWTYVVPNGSGNIGAYGDDIDSKRLYNEWTPANFFNQSVDPKDPKLLGGAWALWNDNSFIGDPGLCADDLIARIQKNCAVVAQKTWASANTLSYEGFLKQLIANGSPVEIGPKAWELTFRVTRINDAPLVLATGDKTDLFAVSPVNGNVGFRREGAQYTFEYALPKDKAVNLAFHTKERKTWITVDGQTVGGTPKRQYYPESCRFFTLPKPEQVCPGIETVKP